LINFQFVRVEREIIMVQSTSTKIGHGLAKVLGIKLDYRDELNTGTTRGESVYSVPSADSFVEDEPRTIDWIKETIPSGQDWLRYVHSLFPFTHWITRYNGQWLIGDLVAGKYYPAL
jgi:solute carrier family 26 (sodium-independent sulfate anion transporter), member 11